MTLTASMQSKRALLNLFGPRGFTRSEKLEYMHANPVKGKLVEHPKDWPWSSWSFYTRGEVGFLRIDPVD